MTRDQATAYGAAWGLILAEARDDPADEETAILIREKWDAGQLVDALAVVAAVLVGGLREHATGCRCGSDQWLEEYALGLTAGSGDDACADVRPDRWGPSDPRASPNHQAD